MTPPLVSLAQHPNRLSTDAAKNSHPGNVPIILGFTLHEIGSLRLDVVTSSPFQHLFQRLETDVRTFKCVDLALVVHESRDVSGLVPRCRAASHKEEHLDMIAESAELRKMPNSRAIDDLTLAVLPVVHQHLGWETTRLVLQDDPPIGVIQVLVKLGRRRQSEEVGRKVRVLEE